MQEKTGVQKACTVIGHVLAVIVVVFAAFIASIFSLAKKS